MNAKQLAVRLNISIETANKVLGVIRGEIDTYSFKGVKDWADQCYNEPSLRERIMCALNELLEGYGVEAIFDHGDKVRAEYVNMGDTYIPTILFDLKKSQYVFTSWGDFVEGEGL